jgi:hypothetical protein
MSRVSAAAQQPEFDFWEFVNCAKCHLPFSVDSTTSPQIPFWLTDCSHVVCNNHLSEYLASSRPAESHVSAQTAIKVARIVVNKESYWYHCSTRHAIHISLSNNSFIPSELIDGAANV